MRVAVIGATGLVGGEMLKVLSQRSFPVSELIPVATEKSIGQSITFNNIQYQVVGMQTALAKQPQVALFSAGGTTSLEWAEAFAKQGCYVIDNSSAWRMHPDKKLIVPEVNGKLITESDFIIANPNCSTIQMVVALNLLHQHFKIDRIVVSTYQSVTGTGVKAVKQLENERMGIIGDMAYKYPIDKNVIPQIDIFLDNGYTKEEMKMVNETKKILQDKNIAVTATCVRIPVVGGHSESINVSFKEKITLNKVFELLEQTPGVEVLDNVSEQLYPMPLIHAHGSDKVFVGRIRMDETNENTINLWVVADNLRKGAATNAVQIAELLIKQGILVHE
ncbi:MAG: aspartate-semialdehyde dehydrogenase [Bacteroidia bacterium]|jgi:aspartate-semialdehyde dehydrogenase|nr:aspartate-semialdehyde dehydrogenase [Bacteroidia bacterium]